MRRRTLVRARRTRQCAPAAALRLNIGSGLLSCRSIDDPQLQPFERVVGRRRQAGRSVARRPRDRAGLKVPGIFAIEAGAGDTGLLPHREPLGSQSVSTPLAERPLYSIAEAASASRGRIAKASTHDPAPTRPA